MPNVQCPLVQLRPDSPRGVTAEAKLLSAEQKLRAAGDVSLWGSGTPPPRSLHRTAHVSLLAVNWVTKVIRGFMASGRLITHAFTGVLTSARTSRRMEAAQVRYSWWSVLVITAVLSSHFSSSSSSSSSAMAEYLSVSLASCPLSSWDSQEEEFS